MKNLNLALYIAFAFALSACSSMSALPTTENVKVSRDEADKDCTLLGKVEGRSMSKIPKENEALEDLKKEAANKGANFLSIKEFSGAGTAATGLAYKCP